jgi:TATA-box binding protein (TBP) (component of TFIID and TFIIIB)
MLIIKTKDNNIINNIFPNGKVISTGAKSEKEAKSKCIKIAKIIKKFGYDISLKDYKIQNIVANYEINFRLNLNKLYENICEYHINNYCKYDRNIFPGLILYINDINVTIFETGNIVISGAKNKKDIEKIFKEIYPLLNEAKT